MSAGLLARLAAMSAGAQPVPTGPVEANRPDPPMPAMDVSGIDTTSAVKPPDAAPDVSPEDPPAPPVIETKRGRGRPKKVLAAESDLTGSLAPQAELDAIEPDNTEIDSTVAEATKAAPAPVDLTDDEPSALAYAEGLGKPTIEFTLEEKADIAFDRKSTDAVEFFYDNPAYSLKEMAICLIQLGHPVAAQAILDALVLVTPDK